jgi:hypothetical protein
MGPSQRRAMTRPTECSPELSGPSGRTADLRAGELERLTRRRRPGSSLPGLLQFRCAMFRRGHVRVRPAMVATLVHRPDRDPGRRACGDRRRRSALSYKSQSPTTFRTSEAWRTRRGFGCGTARRPRVLRPADRLGLHPPVPVVRGVRGRHPRTQPSAVGGRCVVRAQQADGCCPGGAEPLPVLRVLDTPARSHSDRTAPSSTMATSRELALAGAAALVDRGQDAEPNSRGREPCRRWPGPALTGAPSGGAR